MCTVLTLVADPAAAQNLACSPCKQTADIPDYTAVLQEAGVKLLLHTAVDEHLLQAENSQIHRSASLSKNRMTVPFWQLLHADPPCKHLVVPEKLHKSGPACISSHTFDLHSHTALQPFLRAAPMSHAASLMHTQQHSTVHQAVHQAAHEVALDP